MLLVAYRGYSDSEGSPTEKGLKVDALAILDKAAQIAQLRELPVVLFGRSLGGAAAIYACTREGNSRKVRGLVLENTFTSIHDVAVGLFPWQVKVLVKLVVWALLTNRWNSQKLMPQVRQPVLFVKSAKDELVPKRLMDRLQELCEVKHFEYVIP